MTKEDEQNQSPRFGRRLRRLAYAIVPAVFLLAAATAVLTSLEKKKVIVTERPDDRVTYLVNRILGTRMISGVEHFAVNDPLMVLSVFPVTKPEGDFRILLLGESFIMGSPYVHQEQLIPGYGDIANWLAAELPMRLPRGRFEAINAGVGAQTSLRIRQVMEELLPIKPDFIVLATGNNEGFVPATSLNEPLHKWVVYRALAKTLLPGLPPEARPYFSPQDEDTARIERTFQENVREMIALARRESIPIGLSAMPINFKYLAPESTTPSPAAPDVNLEEGKKLLAEGRYPDAIERLAQSPNAALAARYIGECFEMLEQYGKALEYYRVYAQHLPQNRTRPSYNEFIRRIAREEGTPLFDLEKALADASPHGIADETLFTDYCHMTWRGYRLMAGEIERGLIEQSAVLAGFGKPLPRPSAEEVIERYHWQALYAADLKFEGLHHYATP